jgi:hypothetical protein
MTTYTQRQAAKIVNKSRTTVGRHIASGRLSCSKNEDGSVAIDASELIRVYGDECNFDRIKKGTASPPESGPAGADQLRELQAKMESLQEKMLRQYRNEIEHLKEALAKAQDGQVRVTALLEGQRTSAGEWRIAMEEMATKIANQTDTKIDGLKTRHEEELAKLKRALKAEREKSLWARLLGQ